MSDPSPVRAVHLVAKTHLDLGFTDLADAVVERYVEDFFPRAIAVAADLRRRDPSPDGARLVWSTGSWILREALERRGSDEQRAAVAAAIEKGDLDWHGLPLTFHTELLDARLFRHGLSISRRLDERFGRRTNAAKMTDVPGHTRSMVPLLAEAGIGFLHLGVNPAWPVPEVPSTFRWRSPDGAEVVVAYSAGGYGADVVVPGCTAVLSFLHSGDNLGPPSADEVVAAHDELAERYPGAEVRASTLSAYAEDLLASVAVDDLPVVTAEIGDPWLFGAGSDPQKVAAYRWLARWADELADRLPETTSDAIDDLLLLVAEHTWGLDQKVVFPDEPAWDDATLARLRSEPAGEWFEASWAEQRAYVDGAAEVLRDALHRPVPGVGGSEPWGLAMSVADHADEVPRWPVRDDGRPMPDLVEVPADGVVPVSRNWIVRLDPSTGAIVGLHRRTAQGRVLADEDHPLGLLGHQTFSAADYDRFYDQLCPTPDDEWWAARDNTKPGVAEAGVVGERVEPRASGVWWASRHESWVEVMARVAFPPDRPGAPTDVWLQWHWADEPDHLDLTLRVWWTTKPATRLPEASWLSWNPVVDDPTAWRMDKLGQPVSPLDVLARGGRSLHAVGRGGVTYDGPDGALRLETPDAPLVTPGRPNLLDADPPSPDLAGGWHVLLHDNCWGTNFPMWNEGPMAFEFRLITLEGDEAASVGRSQGTR